MHQPYYTDEKDFENIKDLMHPKFKENENPKKYKENMHNDIFEEKKSL